MCETPDYARLRQSAPPKVNVEVAERPATIADVRRIVKEEISLALRQLALRARSRV
ncbi:MAG: hypothetical protein LC798_16765 [Chloroflexi bacterium]|nr:hypothetical protein [Chloroflexota bacterium]